MSENDQALEARARELLAEAEGVPQHWLTEDWKGGIVPISAALRAITAALREGQKAGGQDWHLQPEDKLPCDVRLPPASTINKGCTVGTLLAALEQRVLWGDGYDGKFSPKSLPQPPPGHALVPMEPTEAMWAGLARDIVMWMQAYNRHTPESLRKHLDRCGETIPAWLEAELGDSRAKDHAMEKGTIACLIYKAMIAAAGAAGGE